MKRDTLLCGGTNGREPTDWTAIGAFAAAIITCIVLLVVVLGAASASWTHLRLAFATIEARSPGADRTLVPAFTATAIEVGLFAFSLAGVVLAFLRGERPLRERLDAWSVAAFSAVSFAANVYAGLFALTDGKPADWHLLAHVQIAAVVLFAGALPGLIVLAIHVALEVVNAWRTWQGEHRLERIRERERREKAAGRSGGRLPSRTPADGPANDQATQVLALAPQPSSEASIPERVAEFVAANGPAHWRTVADELGVGKTAVYGAAKTAGLSVESGVVRPTA